MKESAIKLQAIFFIMLITSGVFAQTFGFKGGLSLSNMLVKDNNETYSKDYKMNQGFHIGTSFEFPVDENISVETGLLLTSRGVKAAEVETLGTESYTFETVMNLLYLDIPLYAKLSSEAGEAKIYGLAGAYIGYGLSGIKKREGTFGGKLELGKEDIVWGSDDEADLKPLDFGVGLGAGIELKSIALEAIYNMGLANVSPLTDGGAKMSHKVLMVSLVYKFQKQSQAHSPASKWRRNWAPSRR